MRRPKIAVISMRTVLITLVGLALLASGVYVWRDNASATRIIIYSPEGFKATEQLNGNCFTGSIAAPRAGAFRCMVVNSIYDPCFSTDGTVACPIGDPNRNQGVLLRLTAPLPQPPEAWQNPPDPANPNPWYVALVGGGVCTRFTGTLPSPDFPYSCDIPGVSPFPACMMPTPSASDPRTYVTVCGAYDEDKRDIVNRRSYVVREMWL